MTALAVTSSFELTHADLIPLQVPRRAGDRQFLVGVACALAVHLALLIGIGTDPPRPRTVGNPDGSQDAVNVELVTAADLDGMTAPQAAPAQPAGETPAVAAAQPSPAVMPSPSAPTPTEAARPPPPKPPVQEVSKEPTELPAKEATNKQATKSVAEAREPTPKPAEPPDDAPPKLKREAGAKSPDVIDKELFDELLRLTPPASAPPPPKSNPQARTASNAPAEPRPKAKPLSELDLSLTLPSSSRPAYSFATPDGRGAGFSRPPGITRSGENDEFARRVIAALYTTLPQSREFIGRSTIRITLDTMGNQIEVKLVSGSGNDAFDQAVQYAAKQTNYPFPPSGSRPVDRIFVVTYIYRQHARR